jgi:alkylation response protein AidB-like acyl-CoA dehydrogenase
MDSIYFKEEHNIFRKTLRDFVIKEVRPHVDEWEENEISPKSIFKRMGELGLLGILYPEEYGGSDADYFSNVVFAEEMSRSGALGFTMGILVHTDMASPALHYYGTHEQKLKYLRPVCAGEKIIALGVTEANHGSDVASIETKAIRDGDNYIINGSKMFITNGTQADIVTLGARTGEKGINGLSLFILETNSPGFSVGRKLKKMGMWSSDTAELVFENCVVPAENLLGEEGQGFSGIMAGFENERIVGAIMAYTLGEVAKELSLKYARERTQFGRPIGDFQAVSHMLAEMATDIEAAKQLTYYAAWLRSHKKPCRKEVQMAKLFATEVGNQVADKAVQIHGGYGYIREYEVERIYRDIRILSIGAGTSQIMKNVVSKQLLS